MMIEAQNDSFLFWEKVQSTQLYTYCHCKLRHVIKYQVFSHPKGASFLLTRNQALFFIAFFSFSFCKPWRFSLENTFWKGFYYRQFTRINFCYLVPPIFRGQFRLIFTNKHGMGRKYSQNCKLPKEFARENWGHFMASTILKNNTFGGPTYFDRRWATCLGSWQEGRTGLAM